MSLKIVYVDDEIDLLELFSELFTSEMVQITTISSPHESLNVIRNLQPDLIFLDYRMPGMTGDEVAAKLNTTTPIILITGDINLKPKYDYLAIINKPYEKSEISLIIQKFLDLSNKMTAG